VSVDRFEDAVILSGIAKSEVGRRLHRDPLGLTAEACVAAVEDAGLGLDEIDGLSTYPGAQSAGPGFTGAGLRDIHDLLGLDLAWCSSGVEVPGQLGAVVNAMLAVAGGLASHVLCFRSIWEGTAQGAGGRMGYGAGQASVRGLAAWQLPFGVTAPSLAGILINARMTRYGLTREQLGAVPVNNRANAGLNPLAVYPEPITLDDYLNGRMVSWPLSLYDCDVPCDGATAVVVSRREHAAGLDHRAVQVAAVGCAHNDRFVWEYGDDITRISSRWSTEAMWARTDLRPADVDLAELYDGFSVFSHCWLEDFGFCDVGEAGAFVEGGQRIARDGELPVNTDGGQLSGGRLHGYGFLHEACLQLRGEAGERQVVDRPQVAAVGVGASNSGTTALLLTSG
jgi:acetyl-CoA acetyltransferase